MITEINLKKKVHLVGPYYANISWCTVKKEKKSHQTLVT